MLVKDVRDCYAVLGAIHARWNPVPGRSRIHCHAKVQSLSVSSYDRHWTNRQAVEIQIRTHDMHSRAEYGIAAHWKYKLGSDSKSSDSPDMLWLKQLHEWQQETSDVTEF